MDPRILMNIIQVIVSLVLIVVVVLQSRGAGFGGAFGTQGAVFRTRRGIERTLFRATIALAAVFLIVAILSVRLSA